MAEEKQDETTKPEQPDQPDNTEGRPVGRPLNFESVDDLNLAIEKYLGDCAPHIAKHKVRIEKDDGTWYWGMEEYMTRQKPVTVSGAALALGTSRRTLLSYKDRPEFLPSIEYLLVACEAYAESQLYGPYANGAKFNLINNYRGKYEAWSDKQHIDHTTKGKSMQPKIVSDITPRNARTEAEAAPSDPADQPAGD